MSWADPRRWSEGPRAAVGGAVVFLLASAAPRGGLASSEGFGDHQLYRSFAERITSGELPYRDFFVEYPPGALPVFLAPAVGGSHYPFAFKLLMALCGAAVIALLALTLVRLGATGRRLWLAVAAAALVPAFYATLAVNTYDLWPTLLVLAAVWAILAGRERLSLGALGFAAAAKLVPAILLPLLLAHVWRTKGGGAARGAFAAFCLVGAVLTIPFVLIAPGGVWFSLKSQATRGLHSDSLGASLLFAADQLGLYEAETKVQNPGSLNAVGHLTAVVGVLATLAVVAVALRLYLRGPATPQRLATAAAATSAAPVALGKVLSPQFLVWLIPLVPLVPGALGIAAVVVFWAALAATIVFFLKYVTPFDLDADVWLLVLRNLLLVALLAVLVAAVRAGARRARRAGDSAAAPPS